MYLYPVDNTPVAYVDDILERFDDISQIDKPTVITVGGVLRGWYIQNQKPQSKVITIEGDPETFYLQNLAGHHLSRETDIEDIKRAIGLCEEQGPYEGGLDNDIRNLHEEFIADDPNFEEVPESIEEKLEDLSSKVLNSEKESPFRPENLQHYAGNVSRPSKSVRTELADYPDIATDSGHPDLETVDLLITDNSYDHTPDRHFTPYIRKTLEGGGYVEMYFAIEREPAKVLMEKYFSDEAFSNIELLDAKEYDSRFLKTPVFFHPPDKQGPLQSLKHLWQRVEGIYNQVIS